MSNSPLTTHHHGIQRQLAKLHQALRLTFWALGLGMVGIAYSSGNLTLEKALPLDGGEMLHPSGLVMTKGGLFLTSAKHDDQVFQVTLGNDKAPYQEAFRLARPGDAANLKFTWRGIAGDEDGNFFLLSETAYRVLQVDKKGNGIWLGPSILDAGTEIGLFGGDNSGPDGIARLASNRFLIGASRDPRGLIALTVQGSKTEIKPQKCEKSLATTTTGRHPDFTDLSSFDGKIYALAGAASSICLLKENAPAGYEESECWSFATASQDPKYKYKGLKGIARGLAVDQGHLYVALDNKGLSREADAKDRRPLLLVFKRP